jgi:small subunit ribosomal protein S5
MADEKDQQTTPSDQPQEQAAPAAEQAAPAEQAPAAAAPAGPIGMGGSQGIQPTMGGGGGGRGRGGSGGAGGRGGQGGGGGRGGPRRDRDRGGADESGVESSVVRIYRCSKVVKGGRTFSFGALVVVGDRKGQIGIGYGKANEVPSAVEKGTKDARKQMFKVNLKGASVPHTVTGRSGSSSVVLVPARPGTGVTAGKSVRPCLELVGITDILSKAYGSTSPKNLVKATIDALRQLQNREQVETSRGVKLEKGVGELVTAE